MAEININGRKYTLGDDGLKAGTGDPDAPEEYISTIHNEDDSLTVIGKGSRITNHLDPLYLNDANAGAGIYYYDLPADSWGYGFILVGDAEEYARFMWGRDNHVTLLNASVNVKTTDDSGFCILNNTTSVRLKNSMGLPKRIIFDLHVSESLIAPTFLAFSELSGVDNLDAELTINSITVEPKFRYKLGDADSVGLEPWGYGETLTRVAVATPPTYNAGSPGLGDNDDSCKFNNSDYYIKTTATASQFTTGDLAFEVVLKYSNKISQTNLFGTFATTGWLCYALIAGKLVFYIKDASGVVSVNTGNILTDDTWYHIACFINRDEASTSGSRIYVNGVAVGTGVDMSARAATLAESDFAIGATPGAQKADQSIAYIAAWEYADWMQAGAAGPAEWAIIAAERFARFCGYWPQVANGAYQPTVATRAYPAYLDKFEDGYRKLYYTGNHWMRMCRRQDANFDTVFGYLPETEAENLIVQSENFTTDWSKNEAGDTVTNDAVVCPDGRTKAASFGANATVGAHYIADYVTLTAATYTFSCFIKPGSKNWVYLYATVASDGCFFDVANGIVGTAYNNGVGYIEGPFYSGDATPYYRCCLVFIGSVASHGMRIYLADADNDVTISDGDGSPDLYIWHAQCELGDYMTSPIITSGSALARVVDQLRWEDVNNVMLPVTDGNTFIESGFLECDVLMPLVDAENVRYIAEISDGGDTADMFSFPVTATNDLQPSTRATGLSDGDCGTASADLEDNVKHHLRIQWETDSLKASVDDVFGTEDTSVGMPEDMDRIDLGSSYDAVTQFNGLIQNFYLWNIEVSEPIG